MDLGSLLDGLLRSTAVALGLIGVVEIGLDRPEVRTDRSGAITITVHLHGHVTDQVRDLIQNSARVAIDFELRYFPRTGRKLRLVSRNLIRFHSLTGRYEVRRGDETASVASLEEAAELLGSATVKIGPVGPGLAVIKARASLPDVHAGDMPGALWSGAVPSTSALIPADP